jgi:hypothetical protein
MRRLTLVTALALPLAGLAAPALSNPIAEVVCAPTDQMVQRLTLQFGEVRQATGIRNPEQVIEIWTARDGQSWTLVQTNASGTSCILAMGEHWQTAAAPAAF